MDNSADWIFPKDFIVNPRGVNADGSETVSNRDNRSKTIWFMEDMARELNMDRRVLYSASVFFHRFFLFHSFQNQNRFHVALACFFLGGKIEEKAYKLKELLQCYYLLRYRRKPEESEFRQSFKDVVLAERLLLHTLNFDLTITHPYNLVVNKMRELRSAGYIPDEETRKVIMQAAINFLNDTYRGTFCLEYSPLEIAMAVLYLATISLAVRPVNPNARSLVEVTWISIFTSSSSSSMNSSSSHNNNSSSSSMNNSSMSGGSHVREYRLRCLCLEIIDMYEHIAYMLRESEDVAKRLERQRLSSHLVAEMGGIIPAHLSLSHGQQTSNHSADTTHNNNHHHHHGSSSNHHHNMMDEEDDNDHTTLDAMTPREKRALSFVTMAGDSSSSNTHTTMTMSMSASDHHFAMEASFHHTHHSSRSTSGEDHDHDGHNSSQQQQQQQEDQQNHNHNIGGSNNAAAARRPMVTVTKVLSSSAAAAVSSSTAAAAQTPSSVTANFALDHPNTSFYPQQQMTGSSSSVVLTGGNVDDTPVYYHVYQQQAQFQLQQQQQMASDTPTFSDLAGSSNNNNGNNSYHSSGYHSGNSSAVKAGRSNGRQRSRSNSLSEYSEYTKRVRAD